VTQFKYSLYEGFYPLTSFDPFSERSSRVYPFARPLGTYLIPALA